MTTDITELALITKIKKQLENFDTVILKEDEAIALVEALEKAQQRIAELESRTVKLPEPEQWDITQVLLCKKKVVAAIRAAGIKWEDEK
ncbi:TPA: hypothetical protein ACQZK2_000927 [Klebsiella pneumoniae]